MSGQGESTSSLCLRHAGTNGSLQFNTRTLLRILRDDALFFDVLNPQVACFVVLYTNNVTTGLTAKDIVFGTVHADRLRDKDTLTEQVTPEDIVHIRVAGSELFHANDDLKVALLPNPGNRLRTDNLHPGIVGQNVLSTKRPMPSTHRTISQPTSQEAYGSDNRAGR